MRALGNEGVIRAEALQPLTPGKYCDDQVALSRPHLHGCAAMSKGAPDVRAVRRRLSQLLAEESLAELPQLVAGLHPSDIADLVESLDNEGAQLMVLRALPAQIASETLAEMEEGEERGDLLAALAPERGAQLIHELADDDAADLVGELEPAEQDRILAALPEEEAGEIRDLLSYDEDTAGGIMTTQLVSVPSTLTAAEAISAVRTQGREVENFYTVFVVDEHSRLLGTVPLDTLILADPDEAVTNLVEQVVASVVPGVDQEEVGKLISHYNVVSLPVLGEGGVLLGRITFDDVIDVIEAEQTEDILRMAGVSDEEELTGTWGDSVRTRFPWLLLNLLTASLAAVVVIIFAATIEQFVILAAIMPVIAGMGGNAGTQALAVTVRRIALSDRPLSRRRGAVRKEILVGLANGAALGTLAGVASYLMEGDPILGVVVLLAMWGNIIVGGFAGAFIPTVLDRLEMDPAVASSVFVTTLTDLCGFLLLLGLGTMVLL